MPDDDSSILVSNKKTAWVAWQNTDLTEGKGRSRPLAICELEETAHRLGNRKDVQGCDCIVKEAFVFKLKNCWYGPIDLVYPTAKDKNKQKWRDARNAAIRRAKALGLSEEEIRFISG